jgi:succinate dehydrogenase/fumarate reductase flavoprotein subunit
LTGLTDGLVGGGCRLHGANRLGGNSLAECAVFGRVAGKQAAAHAQQAVARQQAAAVS